MAIDKSERTDEDVWTELSSSSKKVVKKAFVELYAKYSKRLYTYIFRIVHNRELAEDILQDVFMNALQIAKSKTEMENVAAYLFRTARNSCFNDFRKRQPEISIDSILENSVVEDSAEGKYEQAQLLTLIELAVEHIPEDLKEAFILREFSGLSYQEIADILEIDISNVKVRIYRAKAKIREILAPHIREINQNFQ